MPIERNPRIVTRHASSVGSSAHRNAKLQHFPNRGSSLCGFLAVTLHKILALKKPCDVEQLCPAQRFDTLQVPVGNRFAMVEKPMEAFKWHFPIYFLIHIEKSRDAFIVCSVQAERPLVSGEQ